MATLCSHCGFDNPPGMRFCGQCGTRLSEAPLTPASPLAPAALPPENLGVMMGADLLERFHRAGLEAAGQRRNVTVLFADIAGYTPLSEQLDNEDLYNLIQQYLTLLVNDVYKYEGTVDKYTGDGLMALFGAPIAHENNPELAVRAGLDMQADVRRLSEEMEARLGGQDSHPCRPAHGLGHCRQHGLGYADELHRHRQHREPGQPLADRGRIGHAAGERGRLSADQGAL